jgi:carbon-monoxide dehydrogenase small subunit
MMKGIAVSTTVNGDAAEYVCHGRETLLDVLRNHLGLIGAKEGCGTGDCGACSVMLDGELVCSCLVLGAEVEGCTVETVEGLADGDKLHPLQKRFLDGAALQCGICTPGFLVAASVATTLPRRCRPAMRYLHARLPDRGKGFARSQQQPE